MKSGPTVNKNQGDKSWKDSPLKGIDRKKQVVVLQTTYILLHSQLSLFLCKFELPLPTSSSPAIRKSSTLNPFLPPWFFSHLITDNSCYWLLSRLTDLSKNEDLSIRSVVVFLLKTARKSPLPVDEHLALLFGNCLFVSRSLLCVGFLSFVCFCQLPFISRLAVVLPSTDLPSPVSWPLCPASASASPPPHLGLRHCM